MNSDSDPRNRQQKRDGRSMQNMRLTAAVLGSLALTTVGTAVAVADTSASSTPSADNSGNGSLSVKPSSASPGEEVEVRLSCLQQNRGDLSSPALEFAEGAEGAAGAVLRTATVRSGVAPGSYTITATCGDQQLKQTIKVAGGNDDESSSSPDSSAPNAPAPDNGNDAEDSDEGSGQVGEVPDGAPETGGGGMAQVFVN